MQFGGPIMLDFEIALNKQAFTGDEITYDRTDDWWDKTAKVSEWGWKSWMPSAAWIPGSWYWERIGNAARGARDFQGRPYDMGTALSSSVGVKLKPQDVEEGFSWRAYEFDQVERDLKTDLRRLHRDYQRNLISRGSLESCEQRIIEKLENLGRERRRTFEGE